jgi:hypothetical protein
VAVPIGLGIAASDATFTLEGSPHRVGGTAAECPFCAYY